MQPYNKVITNKRQEQQGFTLVEMMIAVGIFSFILIGLLTLIEHMDHKEDWLKARATTNAELDAALHTIEKFWDLIDWSSAATFTVDPSKKKFTLIRPINLSQTETLTVYQDCQALMPLPKALALANPSHINNLKLMKACGGNPCAKGSLPVMRIVYSRGGGASRQKMYPRSANSNISTGSSLGIGMCVAASSDGERIEISLEGVFLSKQDKMAPFRKMSMFRTYAKGNRLGDDVTLFRGDDGL